MLPSARTRHRLTIALMIICAWPGPRPVAHTHGDLVCPASVLWEHVETFHTSPSPALCDPSCPHFHWVFSSGEHGGPDLFPGGEAEVTEGRAERLVTTDFDVSLTVEHEVIPHSGLPEHRGSPGADVRPDRKVSGPSAQSVLCVWTC